MNLTVDLEYGDFGFYRVLQDHESTDITMEDGGPNLPRVCNADGTPKINPRTGLPYGLPATVKAKSGVKVKLTRAWEYLWFDLFKLRNPTMSDVEMAQEFTKLVDTQKAFTNFAGWNDRWSYVAFDILGESGMSTEEMEKEVITTGGNIVMAAGEPISKNGEMCLPFYCLDDTQPPPSAEALHPVIWLNHSATVCRPEKIGDPTPEAPNGIFKVIPFDFHAPVPMITHVGDTATVGGFKCRVDFLRMSRLARVAGAVPSPYVG